MLWLQGRALQELVAQAVVEGAVEAGGAAVGLQHAETLHLVLPVHQQLRLVAVDTHQHHVLHDSAHVAAHQLVGDAVGEELPRRRRRRGGDEGGERASVSIQDRRV